MTCHLALLQLGYVFFKHEPSLSLYFSLLPNRMLREELVCCSKRRVMEHVGVSLQHVSKGRT